MIKYTHLIERCSSFMRTGVAWKLNKHGYTISEAYWRLRDGKGLQSSYDQESLKTWSYLITSIRRKTGPLYKLKSYDQRELKTKREKLLFQMELYRDKLERGSQPKYLYEDTNPHIIEHLLVHMVGDVRELSQSQQQEIWENLDIIKLKQNATLCMKEVKDYIKEYESNTEKKKELINSPDEWIKNRYGNKFVKDKVWQIRTGHDSRSSVKAEINNRLILIWDIPNLTDNSHRDIYLHNLKILDSYKQWKNSEKVTPIDYDQMLKRIHNVLDLIIIPKFE